MKRLLLIPLVLFLSCEKGREGQRWPSNSPTFNKCWDKKGLSCDCGSQWTNGCK